jgi:hypothetical protein
MSYPSADTYIGMPIPVPAHVTSTKNYFQALDNFHKVFAIRPGDKVMILADQKLDPRVIDAIIGVANARGGSVRIYIEPTCQVPAVPDDVRDMLAKADFVVSTWFCSIVDPFNINLRRKGQRWVKITYFRNLDLLHTPQARFPIEIVGELLRATAKRFPKGEDFDLRFTDKRGTDFKIHFTAEMRENQLSTNRWRGKMFADEDGCYVHYLPTHGPNFWDDMSVKSDPNAKVEMSGVIYPKWAVGFPKPFEEKIAVRFTGDTVSSVDGESQDAAILRDMLVGGKMLEGGGCGFNPKAPRHTVYPAGSNSPGVLHFGIDLAKPSDYIRKVMPDWEEPPVHMDLITFDSTVTAGKNVLVDKGFLCALRDPEVVKMAKQFGDPIELLESIVY